MIKLKIPEQLVKHNLTQIQLSQITGINKNSISSYCNNTCKHIVIEHLDKICKALACDISDILEFRNELINQTSLKDMLVHMASHMAEDMTKNSADPALKQILSEVFTSEEFLSLLANKTIQNSTLIMNQQNEKK